MLVFSSAEDVLLRAEWRTVPVPGVEIQDGLGLDGERRIAREDPRAMAPRAQGVLAEPAPQRGPADLDHQPLGDHRALQVPQRPARQRQPALRGYWMRIISPCKST